MTWDPDLYLSISFMWSSYHQKDQKALKNVLEYAINNFTVEAVTGIILAAMQLGKMKYSLTICLFVYLFKKFK